MDISISVDVSGLEPIYCMYILSIIYIYWNITQNPVFFYQPTGVQVIIHLGNEIIMRSMTLVITLINQDLD